MHTIRALKKSALLFTARSGIYSVRTVVACHMARRNAIRTGSRTNKDWASAILDSAEEKVGCLT